MTCCSRVVAKPAKPVVVWWSCRQDLGLRLGFRVRISELVASGKSYSHSLNSFLLEKADLICHFVPSGSALRRRFLRPDYDRHGEPFGTSEAEHGDAWRTPALAHQPVSVEMVQKSAKVGASVMASNSAPIANRKPKRRFQQRGPHAIC